MYVLAQVFKDLIAQVSKDLHKIYISMGLMFFFTQFLIQDFLSLLIAQLSLFTLLLVIIIETLANTEPEVTFDLNRSN